MMHVELQFPILGKAFLCHRHPEMFRAISRLVPEACRADWLQIAMRSRPSCGCIETCPQAELRMRLPQSRISLMLKLAGKRINTGCSVVRLGAPVISLLKPSTNLYTRCVAIKGCVEPERVLDAVAWRLDEMGITGEPEIGPRRRFSVGRRVITGFALKIHDLSEEGSLALQEQGLGSYRHKGCGFFEPIQGIETFHRTGRSFVNIPRSEFYAG
jgi:CRISPR-associated protein Cas6